MAITHAQPGEVVDVRPLGAALTSTPTKTLLRTGQVEVIRMVLPAGKDIPEHRAKGDIVVQCLEGNVDFTAGGQTHKLEAGKLLYLTMGDPHSLKAHTDASILLTVILPR